MELLKYVKRIVKRFSNRKMLKPEKLNVLVST